MRSDLQPFFAGVPEMRAYLERHIQSPELRHARLARLAREVVKPRSASELGQWLTHKLSAAVGASACVLASAEVDWRPWLSAGEPVRIPAAAELAARARAVSTSETGAGGADLLLPLRGIEDVFGALWLEMTEPLDAAGTTLLVALLDMAGVMLERALRLESLIRDPLTGLLPEGLFVERVRQLLEQSRAVERTWALAVFRIAGGEALQEAQGMSAAQDALVQLARAVKEVLPAGCLMGIRFDTVTAFFTDLSASGLDLEIGGFARAVNQVLHMRTTGGAAVLSATVAYQKVTRPSVDVSCALEHLARRLAGSPAGGIVRLDG